MIAQKQTYNLKDDSLKQTRCHNA